ncbi:MAG: hypothetical protein AAFW73_06225 [Bacteroidota bacterium]
MFTINIYLKLALIALNLIGGVVLTVAFGFWYAFPFLLIGIGLAISYFLLGTVQSAANLVQETRFEEAEQRLKLTFKPEWLYQTNRAFYYIIQGTLAMQRKDNEAAEKWLHQAESIELPSDNEKAMVALQLANLQANKGNWTSAKMQMSKLKKLKVTEGQLKEQIKLFEKAMTNRGQAKHMMGMKGGRRKGFRKMR